MQYSLEELLDIPLLQDLQNKLNVIYGLPTAIVDNYGKVLSAVRWQSICVNFHRKNPQSELGCVKSDQYIKDHLHEANPTLSYQCVHGLMENATPIIINGEHMGNFFTGQFFFEKPDVEVFRKQALAYGFDEQEYLKALAEVPIWSKAKLDQYIDFVSGFIEIIARIGMKKLKEIDLLSSIRSSEDKYRTDLLLLKAVFESPANIIIFALDKNYCYTSFTTFHKKVMNQIWGVDISKGMNMLHLIANKQDRDKAKSNFDRALQGESFILAEEYGDEKYKRAFYENYYGPVLDVNNEIVGVSVFVVDVTHRKEAELKVEKLSKHYQSLINKAPDGVVLVNKDSGFDYVSPSAKRMFGYDENEKIPEKPAVYTHPDDVEMVRFHLMELINNPSHNPTLQYRFRHKNGEWIWIESIFTNLLDDENVRAIVINFRNISERKKAEQDLQAIHETYQDIFNSVSEAIYVMDETGFFIDVNSGAEKMYGYSREELIGKNPAMISPPGLNDLDKLQEVSEEVLKTGASTSFEFWGQRKNGEVFPKEVMLGKGKYFGREVLIATARDMTVRKKIENEILLAKEKAEEGDRLKTAFLANMSHEIRTPMNGILGFAELLKKPNLTGEQQAQFVNIIQRSGARMLNVINEIVDISKIESGQMEVNFTHVDLSELLHSVFEFFEHDASAKGLNLIMKNQAANKVQMLHTDYSKLEAILINLIKNAIKYTDVGTVEFGVLNASSNDLTQAASNSEVLFFVRDTGIGIAEERQSAIFERFIQADVLDVEARQGAGLGLAIAKAYAKMLNGKIWVNSQPEKGSTFYFSHPYNP